jgi:hypothetical protein
MSVVLSVVRSWLNSTRSRIIVFLLVSLAARECLSFGVGATPYQRGLQHLNHPLLGVAELRSHHLGPSSRSSSRSSRVRSVLHSVTTATDNRADAFAKIVAKGFKCVELNGSHHEISIPEHSRSSDRITKYAIPSADAVVEAWALPTDILNSWLIGGQGKQRKSLFPDILVRRMDNSSLLTENETMKELLRGNSPIWIGLPGIGKSVASTIILVQALQNMLVYHGSGKSVDGFERVYYRVAETIYDFYWDDIDQSLGGRELSASEAANIMKLLDKTAFDKNNKRAFIVEMDEREYDPQQPGFYTSSSRLAMEKTFKTLKKSGEAKFFVMDPPTDGDLRLMYLILKAFSPSLPDIIDTYEKFVSLRIRVGPIPRTLFGNSDSVDSYLVERESALKFPFDDIHDFSIPIVGNI